MAVVLPALRFIVPVIIGAAIGYATRDQEAEEEAQARPSQSELDAAALQKRMFARGSALLKSRKATAKDSSRSTYIKQTYLGLYCIGRAGGKLKADYAESLARELQHLHTQQRPRKDKPLAAWYQTLGVSNQDSLAELLAKCTEVKQLGVDSRYIAYAFGQTVENLSFDGLLDELMTAIKV